MVYLFEFSKYFDEPEKYIRGNVETSINKGIYSGGFTAIEDVIARITNSENLRIKKIKRVPSSRACHLTSLDKPMPPRISPDSTEPQSIE